MPLHGQAERLSKPAVAGRRQKWILVVLGALTVLAVAAVIVVAGTQRGPAPLAPGCVEGIAPSAVGAVDLHACGAAARQMCDAAHAGKLAAPQSLIDDCRRNGYVY
jgi:hypothetical protein